ncbi:MAG TPA: hypothetical protein HPP80_03070 [Rhodospirillaceae bacterium]|nr:hypothetical protein [Rhodospirillaceae bacterium]
MRTEAKAIMKIRESPAGLIAGFDTGTTASWPQHANILDQRREEAARIFQNSDQDQRSDAALLTSEGGAESALQGPAAGRMN